MGNLHPMKGTCAKRLFTEFGKFLHLYSPHPYQNRERYQHPQKVPTCPFLARAHLLHHPEATTVLMICVFQARIGLGKEACKKGSELRDKEERDRLCRGRPREGAKRLTQGQQWESESGCGTGQRVAPFTKAGGVWGEGDRGGSLPWDGSLWRVCGTSVWQVQGYTCPRGVTVLWQGGHVGSSLTLHPSAHEPPAAKKDKGAPPPPGWKVPASWARSGHGHQLAGHREEPSLPRGSPWAVSPLPHSLQPLSPAPCSPALPCLFLKPPPFPLKAIKAQVLAPQNSSREGPGARLPGGDRGAGDQGKHGPTPQTAAKLSS